MSHTESVGAGQPKRPRHGPAAKGLTGWDLLPEPLIRLVVSSLDLEDCLQAAQISKPWRAGTDRESDWKQHILREWPDMEIVVSRLEADTAGQSKLCKSFRELCVKTLKSSGGCERKGRAVLALNRIEDRQERQAALERQQREAEERRRQRFADVFVRIRVTNRHTKQLLHMETVCLSDPVVMRGLFCTEPGNMHRLVGVREARLEAFQDYHVAISLIDLGGGEMRVAELVSMEELSPRTEVSENAELAEVAGLTFQSGWGGSYGFMAPWEAVGLSLWTRFTATRIEPEQQGGGEDRPWELCVYMQFEKLTGDERQGWDVEQCPLEDLTAVYKFLEPFINSPSLVQWS